MSNQFILVFRLGAQLAFFEKERDKSCESFGDRLVRTQIFYLNFANYQSLNKVNFMRRIMRQPDWTFKCGGGEYQYSHRQATTSQAIIDSIKSLATVSSTRANWLLFAV
jgi:hypothetical protein